MLKQLTVALLILAFTGSTFCRTVIVLDYYANNAAYVKDCINKARLAMHCNGKCQMMKKLEQEQKKEQENQSSPSAYKNKQLFADAFFRLTLEPICVTRHTTAKNKTQKTVDRRYTLLRPPNAA